MNLKRLLCSMAMPRRPVRTLRGLASILAAALVVVVGMAGAFPAHAANTKAPQWVAGELLVGLRAGVRPERAQNIYRAHGAAFVEQIGQIRVVRLRVPNVLMDLIAQLLSRVPEVKFVEKNYILDPGVTPNDPGYASQWHLPRILAPQAWDLTQGAPGVVIAILDSGIDPYHPDLAGKLVPGYNSYDHTTNTLDSYGHGTEVAGVAAAASNNADGVASVAWQSSLMPVRVTNNSGAATSASIAGGITWAADHGASVMNLSFNGVAANATIRAAAEYAYNRGTLVVAASGNCGCVDTTPETPFLLSVSATDETDAVAYFSSMGPYVDISAPGTNILTTALGGAYFADSGTSLASPVVAGVAALVYAVNPLLTAAQVTEILEATATDGGTAGYDQGFGYGRVNAFAAVSAAIGYTPPPDTAPPTASLTSLADGSTVSGTVVVDVSASDNVGVVNVDLYVDGALFASDASAPYSFAWDTTTLSNGSHTLQAIASDAAGNAGGSTTITVTVSNTPPDTTAPTASIGSPTAGATVTGTISVNVSASDDVGVTRVDLYLDGALFATGTSAPYAFAWNTTTATNGSHTLRATASDAAGNAGNSATITVTVNNIPPDTTPPTASINSPSAGATVSGTISVTASASDNVGVTKVDLYLDGALSATGTSAPYSFPWNTKTAANGSHTLKAIATDAAGNAGSSTTISVTVSNVVPDTTPPTVAITSPAAGATITGTVTIAASASDNVGVSRVEFYVDAALLKTDTSAPYSVSWSPATATSGAHTLRAVATDAAGNSTTSTITVTVNRAPIAVNDSYAAPYRSGSSYTAQVLSVLSNDSDPDGSLNPGSVKIVKSPTQGGSVTVNASGTVSYTPRRSFRGTETFSYTVKDNLGTTSNTATVTVTVQ